MSPTSVQLLCWMPLLIGVQVQVSDGSTTTVVPTPDDVSTTPGVLSPWDMLATLVQEQSALIEALETRLSTMESEHQTQAATIQSQQEKLTAQAALLLQQETGVGQCNSSVLQARVESMETEQQKQATTIQDQEEKLKQQEALLQSHQTSLAQCDSDLLQNRLDAIEAEQQNQASTISGQQNTLHLQESLLNQNNVTLTMHNASLETLQMESSSLQNTTSSNLQSLQQLHTNSAGQGQSVGFTVNFEGKNDNVYSPEPFQPLEFDNIVTNVGHHYDSHTGLFTVPVSGLYMFTLHVMGAHRKDDNEKAGIFARTSTCEDNHHSCADWARNGQCHNNPGYMLYNCAKSCHQCSANVLSSLEVQGANHDTDDSASTTAVVHLNAGEEVYARLLDNSPSHYVWGSDTTSFSGALLHAD